MTPFSVRRRRAKLNIELTGPNLLYWIRMNLLPQEIVLQCRSWILYPT